jgi:hypothetical protein
MKHLKSFNEELKSSVYKDAARKLTKLGHTKRAEKLTGWSDTVFEKECYQNWKKMVEDFSIDGTYKFKFKRGGVTEIEDDFYLYISFDDYATKDSFDNGGNGSRPSGYISFYLGVIPTTEESYYECKEKLGIDFRTGYFWGAIVSIPYRIEDNQIIFSKMEVDSYDEDSQAGYFSISDRKTSVRLKTQFWEIFSGKEDYPSGYSDESSMKRKIEKTMNEIPGLSDRDIKYDSNQVSNMLRTMSVNHLYKE